jgi:hypothetical protein
MEKDKNKISIVKRDKKNWFNLERRSKFLSVNPNHRYFTSQIKGITESFLNNNKEYLLKNDPALLYSMRGKPVPKKYQNFKADLQGKDVVNETVIKESKNLNQSEQRDELDCYQEQMKKKKEELVFKRSQKNVAPPKVFFTHCRRDPHRGMGWVNAYEPINKGKLGYAQSWKYQKEIKYRYYD